MAQIPRYFANAQYTAVKMPGATPDAFGAGLGEGLQKLGDMGAKIAVAAIDENNKLTQQREYTSARAGLLTGINAAYDDYEKSDDQTGQNLVPHMTEQFDATVESLRGGITNDKALAEFNNQAALAKAEYTGKWQRDARAKNLVATEAAYDTSITAVKDAAINAPDMATAMQNEAMVDKLYGELVGLGANPKVAENARQKTHEDIQWYRFVKDVQASPINARDNLAKGFYKLSGEAGVRATDLAETRATTFMNAQLAKLKPDIEDSLASLEITGRDPNNIAARIAANGGDPTEFMRKASVAKSVFFTREEAKNASPAEMAAILGKLTPQAGKGAATSLEVYEKSQRAMAGILQERERDGAAAAAAFKADASIDERVAWQEAVGVKSIRALTKTEAVGYARDIDKASPSVMAQMMADLETRSGRSYSRVLGELEKEGISPETSLMARFAGDDSKREVVSALHATRNMKDEDFKPEGNTTPSDVRREARAEFDKSVGAVYLSHQGASKDYADFQSATERLSLYYSRTMPAGSAAKKAVAELWDSEYLTNQDAGGLGTFYVKRKIKAADGSTQHIDRMPTEYLAKKRGDATAWVGAADDYPTLSAAEFDKRPIGSAPDPARQVDEAAFQSWYATWAKASKLDPNPDDPKHLYDYRQAFAEGITPTKGRDDRLHWPSVSPSGVALKAKDHPTYWMEQFMQATGRDPGDLQIKTPEDARRWIDRYAKTWESPAKFEQYKNEVTRNGRWFPNPDGSGLILVDPFRKNAFVNGKGENYTVTWPELYGGQNYRGTPGDAARGMQRGVNAIAPNAVDLAQPGRK